MACGHTIRGTACTESQNMDEKLYAETASIVTLLLSAYSRWNSRVVSRSIREIFTVEKTLSKAIGRAIYFAKSS